MTGGLSLSVVVPVFNGEAFIAEAVGSVRGQGHAPTEILVVDDGSTDRTAEVVRSLAGDDLRYIWQENAGPSAARNRGIRMSRGEVIGFIDADDLWPPSKLAEQLPHLAPGSGADVVLGLMRCFRQVPLGEGREFSDDLFCFVMGCGLYRRGVFDRVGLLDESMRLGEDSDWFNRIREAGVPIKVLETAGILYRRHEGGVTRDIRRARRGFVQAVHRSLARRRRMGEGERRPPAPLGVPVARRPGSRP